MSQRQFRATRHIMDIILDKTCAFSPLGSDVEGWESGAGGSVLILSDVPCITATIYFSL